MSKYITSILAFLYCFLFQDSDQKTWYVNLMDWCKSCIDPSRNINEEGSSEGGYATPRSLETPVQINSKCPSLNQIRDPYALKSHNSLKMTEEERIQKIQKFQNKSNNQLNKGNGSGG